MWYGQNFLTRWNCINYLYFPTVSLIYLLWFQYVVIIYLSQLLLMSHLCLSACLSVSLSVSRYLSVYPSIHLSMLHLSWYQQQNKNSFSSFYHGILTCCYNAELWSQLKIGKYLKRQIEPLMTRILDSVVKSIILWFHFWETASRWVVWS